MTSQDDKKKYRDFNVYRNALNHEL